MFGSSKIRILCFLAMLMVSASAFSAPAPASELYLRDNLVKSKPGDFLVTSQNKNDTVLIIRSKEAGELSIEEITVPASRIPAENMSWRRWVMNGAPGNTSWVLYTIDLSTGKIIKTFSFTRNEWVTLPDAQNFMTTLLNLNFKAVADRDRKKVGPPPAADSQDRRAYWQPKVMVDGQAVSGVEFSVWKTKWPKDGTDLSGKLIEVYVPKDNDKYPSYFPYWLQVSGVVGNAKVRIIDSGSGLFAEHN